MTEATFVWLCPQCATSFSQEVYDMSNGKCADGHLSRDLVKYHGGRLTWRCKACGRRFTEMEHDLNDGKCSMHRNTTLDLMDQESAATKPVELQFTSGSAAIPTEEGEYDFGFGRPAPKSLSFDEVAGDLDGGDIKQSELHQLALGPRGSEMEIIQRTIRVLVDKLGGRVQLNGMEVIYIMQADDTPVPVIEREDTQWGGRIILRTEGGK